MRLCKYLASILLASCAWIGGSAATDLGLSIKWEPYLDVFGFPNAKGTLQRSDLFLPIVQGPSTLTYFNLRQEIDDDGFAGRSAGIGLRHLFGNFVLGAYGFIDWRETEFSGDYEQYSGGAELMHEYWEVRFNGYWPNETTTKDVRAEVHWDPVNQDFYVLANGERNLPGFDGEIGLRLVQIDEIKWDTVNFLAASSMNIWAYAGGYNYVGEDEFDSISGFRGRLEVGFDDLGIVGPGSRLSVGLEGQYDGAEEEELAGWLRLRVPLGNRPGTGSKGTKEIALTDIERRMVAPVIRWPEEVTSTATKRTQALNQTGQPYNRYVEAHSRIEIEELTNGLGAQDAAVFINMIGGGEGGNDADNWNMTDFVTAGGGITYAAAGNSVQIGYDSPFSASRMESRFTPHGTSPRLAFNAESSGFEREDGLPTSTFKLSSGDQINGWQIDAEDYQHGLFLDVDGDYVVTNTLIKNADEDGIRFDGSGSLTVANNSTFSNNGDDGIDIRGDEVRVLIEDSEFRFNDDDGIHLRDTTFAEVTVRNANFNNNRGHGIDLKGVNIVSIEDSNFAFNRYNGIQIESENAQSITVSNTNADRNDDNGLEITGESQMISIRNSTFRDNDDSGIYISAVAPVEVLNSTADDNLESGLDIRYASSLLIENSYFRENDDFGIYIGAASMEKIEIGNTVVNHNDQRGIHVQYVLESEDRAPSGTFHIWDSIVHYNGRGRSGDDGSGIRVRAEINTIEIENLFIDGNGGEGIDIQGKIKSVTVEDTTIQNNKKRGFYLFAEDRDSETEVTISNTVIENNDGAGIDIRDYFYSVLIEHSTVRYNGDDGIYIYSEGAESIDINQSEISHNDTIGVYLGGDINTITIENSAIRENDENGLNVDDVLTLIIEQTIVENNKYTGIYVDSNVEDLTIRNSTIRGNEQHGIEVSISDAKSIRIFDSTIENNEYDGMKVRGEDYTIVRIEDSKIGKNGYNGLDIKETKSVTLIDVDLSNNEAHGIELQSVEDTDVQNSIISNNGIYGISVSEGSSLKIWNTTTSFNGTLGIELRRVEAAEIQSSNISNNGIYGISISDGSTLEISNTTISLNGTHGIFAMALNHAVDEEVNDDRSSDYGHDPVYVNASNISVFGNGQHGIFNAGGRISIESSQFNNHAYGHYFDQIGVLEVDGDQFCIRNDGFVEVDGITIQQTETTPVPMGADCTVVP